MFESNHQLFELAMSACTAKEEMQWRKTLTGHISKASFDASKAASIAMLGLAIKPMGTVFGKPGKSKIQTSISGFRTFSACVVD